MSTTIPITAVSLVSIPLATKKSFPLSYTQQFGQSLNYFALQLSRPFRYITIPFLRMYTAIRPGEFGNCNSYFLEKVRRIFCIIFSVTLLPIAVPMALFGGLVDCAGNYIKQNPYYYVQGKAQEIMPGSQNKFYSLNACDFWGGIPLPCGGQRTSSERIDELCQRLQKIDAGIVVLQEMGFDAALTLIDKLKKEYAHFFTQIGPNPWMMESGLFLASKFPILQVGFIPFPGQSGIRRGAFYVETPSFIFFTAHLHPDDTAKDQGIRKDQLNLITKKMHEMKKSTGKPCFIMGDFNIKKTGQQGDEYSSSGIEVDYYDSYPKKYPGFNENTATCTNYFTAYIKGEKIPTDLSKLWEIDDYALLDKDSKNLFNLDIELDKTFSLKEPEKSLSDHRGLILTASRIA